jgi:hypothetical protein
VVTGTLQGDISLYRSFDGSSGVWNREMSCERIDHTFLLERN